MAESVQMQAVCEAAGHLWSPWLVSKDGRSRACRRCHTLDEVADFVVPEPVQVSVRNNWGANVYEGPDGRELDFRVGEPVVLEGLGLPAVLRSERHGSHDSLYGIAAPTYLYAEFIVPGTSHVARVRIWDGMSVWQAHWGSP